jgi:hypothetical protein
VPFSAAHKIEARNSKEFKSAKETTPTNEDQTTYDK